MKLIKGDKVKVLIGKDQGREGEILQSFPKKDLVTVKGLNLFKKHIKSQNNQPGGIIEKERPLLSSKVALICPSCHKITRIGYQVEKSGDKFRICRKCKSPVDKKTKTK